MRSLSLRSLFFCTLLLAVLCTHPSLHAQAPTNTEGPLTFGQPKAAPVASPPAPQQPSAKPAVVDNDTIIRMAKAGIGDDLLVQTIQSQPGHYDTSPDALIALKQAGISDRVLSTLQAHGTGLAIRANRPKDPNAPPPEPVVLPPSGVDEIGVYYKNAAGQWIPMDPELVHIKSGGFVKSTLTHGIIKEDHNGVVNGTEAKLLLPRPVEFLIYAPDGTQATEYELLAFRLNGKDREFRVLTGGIIHSTGGAQRDDVAFTPVKIAPRTWTFTLGTNTPGAEYGILPPGTGNVTNGGKIYTFAISE
jgi:hypothetical protein